MEKESKYVYLTIILGLDRNTRAILLLEIKSMKKYINIP